MKLIFAAAILVGVWGLSGQRTLAQSPYSIDWHTVDGGGGTSTGGVYSVSGTIGQPEAGTMTGGGYTLDGGSWSTGAADASPETIFDNTSGSVNGGFGVTADTWLASKFCPGPQSYVLDSVSLLLNSQDFSGAAGPPCAVRLQIYSHDLVSGKPSADTGVIMNLSGLTNPITLLGGQQLVKWTPAIPFTLSVDTCYWAVLSAENGKRLGQIDSFTQPIGAAGTFGQTRSVDAGGTWQAPDNGSNLKMLIEGTPVPTLPALGVIAVERSGPDLRLSFTSVAGQNYAIQSSADLSSGTWGTLPGAPTSGIGGPVAVTVTNAFDRPQHFYRVKIVP